MKFSNLFAPTTKEAPKDALLPSHKYLVQAGFIQQSGSGLYNFLPLGKIVLDKIRQIVKDEMDKSGAQEVHMNVVTSAELWKESGRFDVFGKELLRFKDRKENDYILGPTHEEVVVDMVKNRITSYKKLPIHLYQIGTKFRDEARPRFGLLRGREFIMKDGYSFHDSQEDLKREFDLMEKTYTNIFNKLGLNFRAVDADSGAIGGSGSKEFMVLAKNGEDDIVVCNSCSYAANIEAAKRAKKSTSSFSPKADFAKFYTPFKEGCIEEVARFFKIDPFFTIKAVIKKAIFEKSEEIVVFFVRGCDELQEVKAKNAVGALEIIDASLEEIDKVGLVSGYCGPIGLNNVNFFIDSELKNEKQLICGANEINYHMVGVSVSSFKEDRFADLVSVKSGDICSCCGSELNIVKGIEVGHIFQLGQKYSKAMNATFLDKNGKTQPFWMGCYGIGVSRLVAVIIEANHDEKGCIWNFQTTPFLLEIIVSNVKDVSQMEFANGIYNFAKEEGISVLLDDRDERFGFKMNDFELMGFPYALIIGKSLCDNEVEIVERKSLQKTIIKTEDIKKELKRLMS